MWRRPDGTCAELSQPKQSALIVISGVYRLALYLGLLAAVPMLAWPQGTYTTNFPLTENPISEGGRWVNGGVTGLDWGNVQTTGGFAGGVGPASTSYSDPTAILTGSWGPNQTLTATVYSVGASDSYYQEVELRLRATISAHSITGYEVTFRTPNNGSAYVEIVRWNGPLGNFTYLAESSGIGVNNGDVVQATIVGSTISAYINGTLIVSGTDTTYTTGNPGIGFNYGCANTYSDFGFTSFTATDGTTPNPCAITGDSTVSPADVQAAINMSIGISSCTADVAGPDVCNAIVVQRVVNASLDIVSPTGQTCLVSTGLHVVSLSWTDSSSGITGYQISRGAAATGPFTPLATVGGTTTSYMDTTVVSGQTYYYVLTAVAGTSVSSNSTPIAATIPTP